MVFPSRRPAVAVPGRRRRVQQQADRNDADALWGYSPSDGAYPSELVGYVSSALSAPVGPRSVRLLPVAAPPVLTGRLRGARRPLGELHIRGWGAPSTSGAVAGPQSGQSHGALLFTAAARSDPTPVSTADAGRRERRPVRRTATGRASLDRPELALATYRPPRWLSHDVSTAGGRIRTGAGHEVQSPGPSRAPSVGAWRSLVARIVRDDEVGGSNPLAPTISTKPV